VCLLIVEEGITLGRHHVIIAKLKHKANIVQGRDIPKVSCLLVTSHS
jgi:hypothetical protein